MIDEKKLLEKIKAMKKRACGFHNHDYRTGYMSALSIVEGLIAIQSEERSENEQVQGGR